MFINFVCTILEEVPSAGCGPASLEFCQRRRCPAFTTSATDAGLLKKPLLSWLRRTSARRCRIPVRRMYLDASKPGRRGERKSQTIVTTAVFDPVVRMRRATARQSASRSAGAAAQNHPPFAVARVKRTGCARTSARRYVVAAAVRTRTHALFLFATRDVRGGVVRHTYT